MGEDQWIQHDVYVFLRDYEFEDASISEIARETGYGYKQARQAVYRLREDDQVEKSRQIGRFGMYWVVDNE